MAFPHTINIWGKPKTAPTQYIGRYPVYNYSHRIVSQGNYDSASCFVSLTPKAAEKALEQWLGCMVEFYVDNPAFPIWQGYIDRVTFEYGSVIFTIGLEKLGNRVVTNYQLRGVAGLSTTTAVNNTDSQGIFGIKEQIIDGLTQAGTSTAHRTAITQAWASRNGWPQVSTAFGGQGRASLRLDCKGFYHTIANEKYTSSSTTLTDVDDLVVDVVTNLVNGATFFNNADTSQISANTAFQSVRFSSAGFNAWQKLQELAEPGDSAVEYVIGITYGRAATNRLFYYRAQNRVVEYTGRVADAGRIRNLYGGYIRPWDVKPDRIIRYTDVLTGWNGLGEDPRESYIEVVTYDAERQQVQLQGEDTITLDGALRYKYKLFKAQYNDYKTTPRQILP